MSAGADLDARERAAAEELLLRLADDEFVLGERYIEWQVIAPTLESDLALANIAQDELGHARVFYDLLQDAFGHTEASLIWERDPADFRHATLVELPFADGDWADAIVRGFLYDAAEDLRLSAVADSSYDRLAAPVGKIAAEEAYHREHGRRWLERLAEDEEGRRRVRDALDRLFPHALSLFEPAEHEDVIVEAGLRTEPVEALREAWFDEVGPVLDALDLSVPDRREAAGMLPERTGRHGDHTDHWPALHEEFTRTWRELDRSRVRRLRRDDDG